MKDEHRIMQIGSIGAGISALMLVLMAFIDLHLGMEYPGLPVLTGKLALSVGDLEAYLNGIRLLFVLDGFFLCGWLISWVGLSALVCSRNRPLGILTLIFGIAGALFDFGENSIIWGVIQNLQVGNAINSNWVITWKAVQHFSYWLPFIGAIFASIGLWSPKKLDRLTAVVGTLLVGVAAAGLYFPGLSMAANLWFLLWFLCIAVLLWRRAAEISQNSV